MSTTRKEKTKKGHRSFQHISPQGWCHCCLPPPTKTKHRNFLNRFADCTAPIHFQGIAPPPPPNVPCSLFPNMRYFPLLYLYFWGCFLGGFPRRSQSLGKELFHGLKMGSGIAFELQRDFLLCFQLQKRLLKQIVGVRFFRVSHNTAHAVEVPPHPPPQRP